MFNLDASTPQLNIIKNLLDALTSLNFGETATLFSKNFQYEAFNGVTDLAKLDKESYAGMIQGVSAGVTKFEFTFYEVIEAPGKVIIHGSLSSQTASGATLPYDTVMIISIGEEDGELKLLSVKNFPDAQQHNALVAEAIKAAVEKGGAL